MTSTSPPSPSQSSSILVSNPNRWKALTVLSVAQFLIILDTSIIGVALPTIQEHFGITQTDLQWIFNAYVITFGALLLLGGRLSDIVGQRKVFTIGFLILTGASVLAGIAMSNDMLILARVLQGLGAALIAPSALSIVMNLFSANKPELNKAMGIWGAAAPAGGTAGVFLGGIITAWFDWPWIFLINVPIGIAVLALIPKLIPKGVKKKGSIDYLGAITITASLGLLIYSIVTAYENGWTSIQTTLLVSTSIGLFVGFIAIEKRSKDPLIPLRIFKTPNLLSSNIVMALLGASWVSMWFFLNLYLQQILHYGPLESGLALLPMTGLIMVMMTWLMPKLIGKLGVKENLIVGLGLLTVGLILFSFTPANSEQVNNDNNHIFLVYVLPASIISSLGMSFSYIPILISAISNARNEESGVASGLVNTTYQIGSALGLAIMVSLSTSHSDLLIAIGTNMLEASNQGFHLAFIGAAIISAIASLTAVSFIRTRSKK